MKKIKKIGMTGLSLMVLGILTSCKANAQLYYELNDAKTGYTVFSQTPTSKRSTITKATISASRSYKPVTVISDYTFYGCESLTEVNIPSGIEQIGTGAFEGCSHLGSIDLPLNLKYIEGNAFKNSGLSSIKIPANVEYIGEHAFAGCHLDKVIVSKDNKVFDSRDNCNAIIKTESNELIFACESTIIPDTVTSYKNFCFYGLEYDEFKISSSISNIGPLAFDNCDIKNISVDENNPIFDSRDNCNGIVNTSTNELIYAASNIVIPNTVTSLGARCFSVSSDEIVIPSSVEKIGGECFLFSDIETITISSNVKEIGFNAFPDYINVVYQGTYEEWKSIGYTGEFPFYLKCTDVKKTYEPSSMY